MLQSHVCSIEHTSSCRWDFSLSLAFVSVLSIHCFQVKENSANPSESFFSSRRWHVVNGWSVMGAHVHRRATTADSFLSVVLLQDETLTEDTTGQVNIVNIQWIWVSWLNVKVIKGCVLCWCIQFILYVRSKQSIVWMHERKKIGKGKRQIKKAHN